MERGEVEALIRRAFAGVRLGSGVSIRQAEAIDSYSDDCQSVRLTKGEIVDDWSQVPEDELRRDNVSHLDREGLRYYLPALMLWMVDHYNDDPQDRGADMTITSILGALAPGESFRDHQYGIYDSFFTEDQRRAIAAFVAALPQLVQLDWSDVPPLERSLGDYWGRYLTDDNSN